MTTRGSALRFDIDRFLDTAARFGRWDGMPRSACLVLRDMENGNEIVLDHTSVMMIIEIIEEDETIRA